VQPPRVNIQVLAMLQQQQQQHVQA
jgi:hypothetical protein